jgi:hypothetical protein
MKHVIGILIALLLGGNVILGQDVNAVIYDTTISRCVLIGYADRHGLQWGEFAPFYKTEYSLYNIDKKDLNIISNNCKNISITIVLATWCHDSKEQVPRFLKILDETGFKEKNLTLIGVDRQKLAGNIKIGDLYVERVPTFIFYRDNQEIGRIIETPQKSLEEDFIDILLK